MFSPIIKIFKFILIILIIYLALTTLLINVIMHKKSKIDYELDINKKNDLVSLIESPDDAINIRLNLLDKAKESIDICYYDFDTSDTATVFFDKIFQCANKGIKVRILINKITNSFVFGEKWRKELLAAHPNIELYYYGNSLLNFYKLQDNLHDKVVAIDDQYLLVGGRNVSDRFFVDDHNTVFDLDLVIKRKGSRSAVDDYNDYYQSLIDLDSVKMVENKKKYRKKFDENMQKLAEARSKINFQEENIYDKLTFRDVNLYFIHNNADQFIKDPLIFNHIGKLAKNSKKISWVSPYIVFSKPIQKSLDIKNWQADADFITNSSLSTPNFFAFSATYHYASSLKKCANLYSYIGKGSLHSKAILFDDNLSAVGTLNLDPRSAFLSTETMTFIEGKEFNSDLRKYVGSLEKETWDLAEEKTPPLKKAFLLILSLIMLIFIPLT
ncbi:MAG: phosphatidylserine/phosphatidylglycerophosphate/cardiolipin synthase family protein [Finegoldia sp.]|nr:phosphatidylserine/phosphatidylglycerophosphate/cardiolipin synthase family protein [Finegoldia sp.]